MPDQKIKCPQQVEHFLTLILNDIHPELLPEWLYLMQLNHFSVSHHFLPRLIEKGKNPKLCNAIYSVIDARGAWLIHQNPLWKSAYSTILEKNNLNDPNQQKNNLQTWNLGKIDERVHALKNMRAHDPIAALATLQLEWAKESSENRSKLITALEVNLSMNDEAFLEYTLDDSHRDVRGFVQFLLTKLPESKLVQRCKTILQTLIRSEKRLFRAPKLEITLPELNASMQRDGIDQHQEQDLGPKLSLLVRLISILPCNYWLNAWQISIQELIQLIDIHEYRKAFFTGLLMSIARELYSLSSSTEANPTTLSFYQHLLKHVVTSENLINFDRIPVTSFKLFDATTQNEILESWLSSQIPSDHIPALIILCSNAIDTCNFIQINQLSKKISPLFKQKMLNMLDAQKYYHHALYQHLRKLTLTVLNRSDIDELVNLAQNNHTESALEKCLKECQDIIIFRESMQQAFLHPIDIKT
ncbi:MAG: hypothetical protein KGO49_02205 [Gammaproteobacteria bacterium]|nr:hypothetical protein [Gammaproteobacteria bacterium]